MHSYAAAAASQPNANVAANTYTDNTAGTVAAPGQLTANIAAAAATAATDDADDKNYEMKEVEDEFISVNKVGEGTSSQVS